VATSGDDLLERITRAEPPGEAAALRRRRLELAEPYLGTVDGRASERVWAVIARVAADWATPSADVRARRITLGRESAAYCRREAQRARVRMFLRRVAHAGSRATAPLLGHGIERRLAERVADEQDRVRECDEALSGRYARVHRLVGRRDENLLMTA